MPQVFNITILKYWYLGSWSVVSVVGSDHLAWLQTLEQLQTMNPNRRRRRASRRRCAGPPGERPRPSRLPGAAAGPSHPVPAAVRPSRRSRAGARPSRLLAAAAAVAAGRRRSASAVSAPARRRPAARAARPPATRSRAWSRGRRRCRLASSTRGAFDPCRGLEPCLFMAVFLRCSVSRGAVAAVCDVKPRGGFGSPRVASKH